MANGSEARAERPKGRMEDQAAGGIALGSHAETTKPAQLNPELARWLMGYPTEWGNCADTATPSSRKSRQSLFGLSPASLDD